MTTVHLLGAKKSYDTSKQVLRENQIVVHYGMGTSITRFVVYRIEQRSDSYIYHLINIETKAFSQTDLPRPLSEKFGTGMYYNDQTSEFMDAFEVVLLHSEAENIADEKRKEREKEQEHRKQLKAIGKQRFEAIVPDDVKAVIVAELHEDDSDSMTDYYGYKTIRTVILGFSAHTKDMFSELRKNALHFEGTAHLAEENPKYEHREKYTGGAGYYLGESKYHGWVVRKSKYHKDRGNIINAFALIAGEESNICVRVQTSNAEASESIIDGFLIVDYSGKAIAVFGDTKPIKEQLKALGGRFNPKLTYEGSKKAGWIFAKSKEQEIRDLLTIKHIENETNN